MPHNASLIILGSSQSSMREAVNYASDPATYKAGLCVSLASTGVLSLLKSAGQKLGISLGASLSDHKKTAVIRSGEKIPVLATLKRSTGVITVSDYAALVSGTDDVVTVGATAFTAQAGAATPGDATFRAATSNNDTAVSLAAQINAHATASTLVHAVVTSSGVVTLYSKIEGAATGHDVALSYTDNDTNVGIVLSGLSGGKLSGGSNTISDIAYIALGAKMYINDVSGKADIAMSGYSTISDAVYVSLEMTGLAEDDSQVAAALVDMVGGL